MFALIYSNIHTEWTAVGFRPLVPIVGGDCKNQMEGTHTVGLLMPSTEGCVCVCVCVCARMRLPPPPLCVCVCVCVCVYSTNLWQKVAGVHSATFRIDPAVLTLVVAGSRLRNLHLLCYWQHWHAHAAIQIKWNKTAKKDNTADCKLAHPCHRFYKIQWFTT